ncbi:MAG: hypothetical protein AAF670_08810, partial [Planctomycetota bacterium]
MSIAAVEILRARGPMLSGELANKLVDSSAAKSTAAARKLIQRARDSGDVISTDPVRFNQSFLCYLPTHDDRRYAAAVRNALKHRPPLNRVYKVIMANRGYITSGQIAKAASCSDGASTTGSNRLTPDAVIEQAQSLKLIESVNGKSNLYQFDPLFGVPDVSRNSFIKRLELEDVLAEMACKWMQHCYLLPPEARMVRPSYEEAVTFNQNWWDLNGPIYIGQSPDTSPKTRKASNFLVGDILSYRQVSVVDAESFLDRVADVRRRWKAIKLHPVLIGAQFSESAWTQLRRNGVA